MSTPRIIQHPGGDTASEDVIIGALGQIRIDTARQDIRVHDGITPGGKRLPNIDAVNALIAAAFPAGVFANFTFDAIGSYCFVSNSIAGATNPGVTIAGGTLTPTGIAAAGGGATSAGGPRTGTWRCMGYTSAANNQSLFARIT